MPTLITIATDITRAAHDRVTAAVAAGDYHAAQRAAHELHTLAGELAMILDCATGPSNTSSVCLPEDAVSG